VRTTAKRNPRMVKRRNSPYASHNRFLSNRVAADYRPLVIEPLPLAPDRQPMRPLLMRRFGHPEI
jgi:hypothetical protein